MPADYEPGIGGTIAAEGDLVLLVSRRGRVLRLVERDGERRFEPVEMALPSTLNNGVIAREFTRTRLGYKDLLIRARGPDVELTLSYLVGDPEGRCPRLVVAQATVPRDAL